MSGQLATPRPVTPIGIAAERLSALAARSAGAGCDEGFATELAEVAALVSGLDDYLELNASPESAACSALASRTARHDWSRGHENAALEQEMLSGNVEAQTLAILVRATGARHVLEIGTFSGYATLAIAEAVPADGRVVTCELDPTVAEFARTAFAASDAAGRIEVIEGPASDALDVLAARGASFDLVFVDADKSGYAGYVDTLLTTGLLAERGLLCIDNTLMQGEPWVGPTTDNGVAITAFNEGLRADARVRQVIVPLRDGLTLACREWMDER